jgi:serine/threonine protein kinase
MNHHLSHSNLDDSSDITSTSFGTTSSSYHDDDDGATDQRSDKFDILSFMSVVSKVEARTAKEWAPFVLLSIHLGPWNSFFPSSPYRGNSFSVTLIPGDMFLRLTPVGLDSGPAGPVFPQLVAVKTPLLEKGDDKKKKNSHLFRSISKEYQILRSELLRRHDNVINAYGCCWQSLDVYDGLPIPCLILEGTELGDLAKFCQTHELTLRERLRMCIQITEGVQAIHAMGIIHGDLKPNNILVFQSKPDGYIAKIADFGEAIVLAENEPPFRRPAGTTLYSPPEYYNPVATFDENGLLKAEIFSLGVVLSSLVQGMHIIQEMKKKSDLESSKKEDGFASWLASLSGKDQESAQFTNHDETTDSAASWETDTSWRKNCPLADEQLWEVFLSLLDGTLAASPARRFKTDEEVLTLLRRMLTLNLRRTLMCRGEASTTPLDQLQLRNPQWTAQGSAQLMARWSKLLAMPMSVSKAELRKATGDDITISSRLDGQEVEAISLSCLMRHSRPNFSRDFRFIEKYTTGKRRKLHSTKRRMRLFRPFGQARDTRVLGEHKEFGKLVRHFTAVKLALYVHDSGVRIEASLTHR